MPIFNPCVTEALMVRLGALDVCYTCVRGGQDCQYELRGVVHLSTFVNQLVTLCPPHTAQCLAGVPPC